MSSIASQLTLNGLDETLRRAQAGAVSPAERRRMTRRVEATHDIMSALPTADELSFYHSGMCQTTLPHSRPEHNHAVWRRTSGRFSLMVTPGVVDDESLPTRRQPNIDELQRMYVGVPYGPKARLILIHLQTEGVRSRTVNLGPSLSAFLRSLGLPVTGGPRGSINAVREQCLRIARCTFSMQWTDVAANGDRRTQITDTRIAKGLDLWHAAKGDSWTGTIELTEDFHEHLRDHAVPLDKRGIAHLAGNSLGLDLYTLFAYRLPKLGRETHIRWESLLTQIGADYNRTRKFAEKVREVMPDVMVAYPHARVDVTSTGLSLAPSQPAVPRPMVRGFRLLEGPGTHAAG